jgi:hypothetical protein
LCFLFRGRVDDHGVRQADTARALAWWWHLGASHEATGHSTLQISQNRLKLLVWWMKHMWRTSREVDDLTDIQYDCDIKPFQNQKAFEDALEDAKEPAPPTMTLSRRQPRQHVSQTC